MCDNKESDQPNRLESCSQADARNINRSCGLLHICRNLEHDSLELELFAFCVLCGSLHVTCRAKLTRNRMNTLQRVTNHL